MNFLVHDKELLKQYNAIWDKIINLLKKEFDSEPVYNDEYIKTKINLYNDKLNTNFHGNKIPEENERFACFSVLLLDSVVQVNKKYYPHILLEECKYAERMINKISSNNQELNLDESDGENSEN